VFPKLFFSLEKALEYVAARGSRAYENICKPEKDDSGKYNSASSTGRWPDIEADTRRSLLIKKFMHMAGL
jgi:hypothetical protein